MRFTQPFPSVCVCLCVPLHVSECVCASECVLARRWLHYLLTELCAETGLCVLLASDRARSRGGHAAPGPGVLCVRNSQVQTHLLWKLVGEDPSQRLPQWVLRWGINKRRYQGSLLQKPWLTRYHIVSVCYLCALIQNRTTSGFVEHHDIIWNRNDMSYCIIIFGVRTVLRLRSHYYLKNSEIE